MPEKGCRMKIVFISMIRDPWGGSEELWFETAVHALSAGDTVIHSAFKTRDVHPKKKWLKDNGATIFYRPGITETGLSTSQRLKKLVANYLKNKFNNPFRAIFSLQPDIVVYTGTAYSIAKEKYLLPFLDEYKGQFYILAQLNTETSDPMDDPEAAIVKKYFEKSERVFFVSGKNLLAAEHHLAVKIPNAQVVRNPVNVEPPSELPFPRNQTAQIAMVGNLVIVHKGQDLALAVFSQKEWLERDFILNVYGRGPDEEYLKNLVSQYGLAEKVRFHGHVKDVKQIWEKNHILLMPSHMEGMPLAVVEAMLCFRPVVATGVGGIPEWIKNDEEGFISENVSVTSLSLTMEAAWQNRNRWEDMGRKAREKALKLYDPRAGKTLYNLITSKSK